MVVRGRELERETGKHGKKKTKEKNVIEKDNVKQRDREWTVTPCG